MVAYFSSVKIMEMLDKEQKETNGSPQKVLDYILDLEESGQYSPANICDLKATYYSRIDDDKSAFYWTEQAYLLDPTDRGYGWAYIRYLMDFSHFNDALVVLSKIIELEKDMEVQWYTSVCIFAKSICYYYLKDYKNCYHYLKDLDDDFSYWLAGGLHSKADMMNMLRGFGYR